MTYTDNILHRYSFKIHKNIVTLVVQVFVDFLFIIRKYAGTFGYMCLSHV